MTDSTAHSISEIIGQRYLLLEELGRGGMGTVYRAHDRLTDQTIALKRVMVNPEQLMFASRSDSLDLRVALAHEFQMLASLRHPHIISVLDYGFHLNTLPSGKIERQPYFTMELLDQPQTISEAGGDQAVDVQVDLLIQMLQALDYLHRRGLLHRDLKPDNVLVVNGEVRVVDFGLSMARHEVTDAIVGTLAYIAPEVLRGGSATEASDFYAVGVMACELLAGRYPFQYSSLNDLMMNVVYQPVDLSDVDLDPALIAVIMRLLSKNPEDRYSSATEIIREFNAAVGRPAMRENQAIRESFLQAARFVGRESEINRLKQVLSSATEHHQGSVWLIGGESGVGKSRLLDELRTQALVTGVPVVRGQSVSEGRIPYQPWREVIRWLSLIQSDTLEPFSVSILKPLVPDLETLLNRPIPDAPELDPRANQERLLQTIEQLFLAVQQPLLVVLEDFHWAGSESLAVLARLIQTIPQLPILILASYRDDERPGLPGELPGSEQLKLVRLARESIADLSESMLGANGREAHLVNMLERETEGNVFFLVEVMRALAEDAGGLENIGHITLPEHIFANGIQSIIRHRLERIPPEMHPLLKLAAVLGRQIDLDVMRTVLGSAELEQWLLTCADAAVLDVQDNRWRFAHDKLRETLIHELVPVEQRQLHRQAAEAIEQTFAPESEALTARFGALANHWTQAGDAPKAVYYTALAGKQALLNGAYQEAITLLQQVMRDLPNHPELPLNIAIVQRQLADAYLGMGRMAESRPHFEQAAGLMGYPIAPTMPRLILRILGQVGQQFRHRMGWYGKKVHPPEKLNMMLEAARAYGQLAEIYYNQNDSIPQVAAALQTLNLAENASVISPALARGYGTLAVAAGLVGFHKLAHTYLRLSTETAAQIDDAPSIAYVGLAQGMYYESVSRWDDVRRIVREAIRVCDEAGEVRVWALLMVNYGNAEYHASNLAQSLEIGQRLYDQSHQRSDIQMQVLGLTGKVQNLLRLGRTKEVIEISEMLLQEYDEDALRAIIIIVDGVLALAHLHDGNLAEAQKVAERNAKRIGSSSPTSTFGLDGYAGTTEVFLALYEQWKDAAWLQKAKQSHKKVKAFAKSFPLGTPCSLRLQGMIEWFEGKKDKAQATWAKSLAEAQQRNMPYEEALTRLAMVRYLDNFPETDAYRAQAIALLEQIGALYDLEQAKRI